MYICAYVCMCIMYICAYVCMFQLSNKTGTSTLHIINIYWKGGGSGGKDACHQDWGPELYPQEPCGTFKVQLCKSSDLHMHMLVKHTCNNSTHTHTYWIMHSFKLRISHLLCVRICLPPWLPGWLTNIFDSHFPNIPDHTNCTSHHGSLCHLLWERYVKKRGWPLICSRLTVPRSLLPQSPRA